ncbi:MAG: META domain-containing protein [Candidatus Pacebacteria bacterium]|nr:META domain-containing protein [Candidatus Paceibacterota bacterium]
MKKIFILIAILCGLIVLLLVAMLSFGMIGIGPTPSEDAPVTIVPNTALHDATFLIGGQSVTLKDGKSEMPTAPGSIGEISTEYFGNDVVYDFNGDSIADRAFIVAQSTGGTGVFYYVVAILSSSKGNIGSEGYFLGDRIAPQTTEMNGNIIVVNYADRKPADSFTTPPSVGKTVRLILDPKTMTFGIVANNFEGEANPAQMTLTQQKWNWISIKYSNGANITPKIPSKFSLTFKKDGTFSASTDCNGVGGEYKTTGSTIVFDKMMSTLMYCDGSQEGDFSKAIGEVSAYRFTSKGELIFDLKQNSGTMTFN